MPFGRKHLVVWCTCFVLSGAMLACGSSQAPSQAPAAATRVEQAAAAFQIVDPTKFGEPPENVQGGIPKADLEATPKHGGVVKTDAGNYPRLDPHFPNIPGSERFFARNYASGLVTWDMKTNAPTLDLAESWEMAPDGMSYTFKIRKGVKFHHLPPVNGRELTVEDVKWSLDRASGLTRQPGQASLLYPGFLNVQEFQIADSSTLRMVMKQPDNTILRELMYEFVVILPKEAAIDGGFGESKTLIGTGPFIVDLAQSQGLTRLKRNPDWFAKGPTNRPYLDAIENQGLSGEALAAAFSTKQIDWVMMGSYASAKRFIGNPELRIFNTRGNIVGNNGLWINPYVEPLKDIRVRRAIHLAVDRDEIIATLHNGPGGGYAVGYVGGYWQPWFWPEEKLRSLPGWRSNKEEDYAEARKLLAEAGYPNGLTITVESENQQGAELLTQQMKRVGITFKVNNVPNTVLRFTTFMKDKQIALAVQGAGYTPDFAVTQGFLCNSTKNLSTVCDDEIERLHKELRRERDEKKMVELLDKIQQRIHDLMVVAPTTRGTLHMMSYNYVRGWRNSYCDARWCHGHDAANVWLDK